MTRENHYTMNLSLHRLVVVSGIAGGISAVVKSIVSGTIFYIGLSKWFNIIDAGAIVFRREPIPLDLGHMVIALLAHALFGSAIAIGLGMVFMILGKRYYLLIGAFYGFLAWIVVRNFLVSITLGKGLSPLDVPSATSALLNHFLWGALARIYYCEVVSLQGRIILGINSFTGNDFPEGGGCMLR